MTTQFNLTPPKKFTIIHKVTKHTIETNIDPSYHRCVEYIDLENGVQKRICNHEFFINTRYEAQLRLYNYLKYKRNGLEIPSYSPYKNTDIGISVPILNF